MPQGEIAAPARRSPPPQAVALDETRHLFRPQQAPRHRFAYIGIPHDAATSLGNPGARFGPQALRGALKGIFGWRLESSQLADIDRGIIDLSAEEVADLGDLALSYHDTRASVKETYEAVKSTLGAGVVPSIAGGDHGLTYPCIKALHDTCQGAIGLIQLGAHCDLLDHSSRQGRYSGSSGMRWALELERLDSSHAQLLLDLKANHLELHRWRQYRKAGYQKHLCARVYELSPRIGSQSPGHFACPYGIRHRYRHNCHSSRKK